ncbi:RimJ/RimL family protein N-acetyltransferase [Streptomyces sp. Amel2xB2]|uniref:GNAT family N-acetyltransferase n=1 Tax=Streptomyces sp. Amel2xB2 TaxID=1305829 RepID=UPI000DBA4389|nr:GNAT family N-acetyltransferase [Streptomyces sp. Amel2xB2]RAJ66416.1 RimJ/RimL family protein N-acetyltransferase [Streptomyces sp. Amel2xB2]
MERPAELLRHGVLELRRWRCRDADVHYRVVTESLAHLLPWMPWAAERHSPDASLEFVTRCEREWAERQAYNYAVSVDGSTVGSCSLMRRIGPGGLEIGYWIHPSWTRGGLATSAAAALLRAAFALPGVEVVEIHHDEANEASGGVPRRLGFTEVERRPAVEGPSAPGESGIEVVWRADRHGPWLAADPADGSAPAAS